MLPDWKTFKKNPNPGTTRICSCNLAIGSEFYRMCLFFVNYSLFNALFSLINYPLNLLCVIAQ